MLFYRSLRPPFRFRSIPACNFVAAWNAFGGAPIANRRGLEILVSYFTGFCKHFNCTLSSRTITFILFSTYIINYLLNMTNLSFCKISNFYISMIIFPQKKKSNDLYIKILFLIEVVIQR